MLSERNVVSIKAQVDSFQEQGVNRYNASVDAAVEIASNQFLRQSYKPKGVREPIVATIIGVALIDLAAEEIKRAVHHVTHMNGGKLEGNFDPINNWIKVWITNPQSGEDQDFRIPVPGAESWAEAEEFARRYIIALKAKVDDEVAAYLSDKLQIEAALPVLRLLPPTLRHPFQVRNILPPG